MSRREIGFPDRDRHRDSRHDIGRSVRYPLQPPPSHRERLRGDSPRNHRMRSISPLRSQRDNGGRIGRREPSPRRRASRSPVRGSRHLPDGGFHNFGARSRDGYRRRSLEAHPLRDSSREHRMRSPRSRVRSPPPPPPPRSPRLHMHPVSPRFSIRHVSPQLPPRHSTPHVSIRPASPRLAMRPLSPQASILPLSPQVPLHPTRMPMSRSPPLAATFDRELDRHVHESILGGSRNGPILALQSATSLGPGTSDVHSKQEDESLSSSGMLVPRSIFLEDGTVGTFYSLPPNPLLNPLPASVETSLGGKLLPPFSDGLNQYSMETAGLKYTGPEKYIPVEHNYLPAQDQRIPDRALPSQNQYVDGDRNLPEYSAYKRDRLHSPLQSTFDRPFQRRASRSPLHARDGVRSSSREVYSLEMERAPRRMNFDQRESTFSTDIPSRGGFNSPHKRRSDEEYRRVNDNDIGRYGRDLKYDELLRASEEGRAASQRCAPSGFEPPRQRGVLLSPEPRDRLRFEPRDVSFLRQTRTPPREPLRHEDAYLQRNLAYRSDSRRYPSPDRNVRMSPRRMRSLTPPIIRRHVSYEEERRAWKRKFIEMGGDPSCDLRNLRTHEPEFKRREREGDMHHGNPRDRRPSGWDRQDGWPERQEDGLNHPGHRPPRERSGSPRLSRRFHDTERRSNERNVKEQRGRVDGVKTSARQQEMHELAPDLPEDSPEFKQQVQRAFLKYAKVVNEDSDTKKKYKEQGKAGTLLCVACGRLSKPFVDTHSLVMHTFQSKKKGLRADHLGLCKAICSFMGWSHAVDPAGGKSYQTISVEEARANKEDLILWPPAVIVHNVFGSKITEDLKEDAVESTVKQLLQDRGLSFQRIKISVGRQGTVIIKYLPVLSCLHDAEHLHKHFALSALGRDDWLRMEEAKKEPNADNALVSKEEKNEKKSLLYGHLALADDLDKVDLDLHRRCQIKSRKDIEVIAGDPLAVKKGSD